MIRFCGIAVVVAALAGLVGPQLPLASHPGTGAKFSGPTHPTEPSSPRPKGGHCNDLGHVG